MAQCDHKEEENLAKIKRERELAYEKEKKEQLAAKRKERAAEVEAARKAMVEAQKNYKKVLENFIKDYHSYHYSTTSFDDIPTLFDMVNFLL